MKKLIANIGIAIFLAICIYLLYQSGLVIYFNTQNNIIQGSNGINITDNINEQILSGINNLLSGTTESGSINTGNTIINPQTDIEKFYNTKNKKDLLYTIQPSESHGEWQSNSDLLRNYAISNMQNIDIPSDLSGGYLYIKLRKDLPAGRSAVIYIKTDGFYCGGGIKRSLGTYNTNEYLYDLRKVDLIAAECDGSTLFNNIKGKTIYIGGYVGTFDGNGIEKITIARY